MLWLTGDIPEKERTINFEHFIIPYDDHLIKYAYPQSSLIIFKSLKLFCEERPGADVSAFQCVEMFSNRGQDQENLFRIYKDFCMKISD